MPENTFEKEYKRLNKEQKLAVDTIEGPVMVNAGPGTGKTQILTLRIGNILKQADVQPENILALTFTNSGVYAMRERLRSYIGESAYRVNIFTFHAFAEHVIKNFPAYFAQFEYAKVIDDLQKVKSIEKILDNGSYVELIGKHDDYQKVKDITKAINTIKHEGYSVEQFKNVIPKWKEELLADPDIYYKVNRGKNKAGDIKPAEEEKIERKIRVVQELVEVYEKYQEYLRKEHLYDFSDMIITVVEEIKTNENLKFEMQEQYQYILVDEHQDTNMGQNELVELLTDAEHLDGHANIFTVGDEKQSIYRFQGASEDTFKHFNSIYNDIVHIDLKQNYRSTKTILNASGAVIKHSIENPVELESNTKEDVPIKVGEFSNYKFELLHLVQDIKKKIESGVSPEEIAVLFRSNKHTEDIKNILALHKIPFTIFSRNSIFEDIDIQNIILLLRIILNPNDEESLGKVLFINFLNLDGYDAIKILQKRQTYKREQNKTLFDILNDTKILEEIGITHIEQFIQFSKIIRNAIVEIKNTRLIDFLKDFLQNIGYTKFMLESDLSRDKLFKIDKLFDEIKKQQAKGRFDIEDFITLIDSYYAYHLDIENDDPEIESGVQLMTAHGSKGKEFEYVYIVNTTSKNWEKSRGFGGISLPVKTYQGDIHDERRLFYVSMTRAKKELFVTYSLTDWEGKEQEKSRFITEIPNEYVESIDSQSFEKKHIKDISLFVELVHVERTIYDADFIKELFIKRGLTVTALNNYLDCPIKYFYKNLIQIPSGYSPILEYGNVMHGALEKFFLQCKKEERILPKKVLIDLFEDGIEHSQMNEKEIKKYKDRGIESLGTWYESRFKNFEHLIDVERKIYRDFELSNGEIIMLNGKLDKIEYLESPLEGPIRIVDYKTGRPFSKKTKDEKEELKRQLTFYNLLLENYHENKYQIKEAMLDFLEDNDKGEHEQFSYVVSDDDLSILKRVVEDTAIEIMSGELLNKGCKKKDCEWCKFHG